MKELGETVAFTRDKASLEQGGHRDPHIAQPSKVLAREDARVVTGFKGIKGLKGFV